MMTVREPRKLPVILSPEEVRRLLHAAPGLKDKGLSSLFEENGLTRVFQAVNPERNAGIYILAVGAHTPDPWREKLPQAVFGDPIGDWIGAGAIRNIAGRRRGKLAEFRKPNDD